MVYFIVVGDLLLPTGCTVFVSWLFVGVYILGGVLCLFALLVCLIDCLLCVVLVYV